MIWHIRDIVYHGGWVKNAPFVRPVLPTMRAMQAMPPIGWRRPVRFPHHHDHYHHKRHIGALMLAASIGMAPAFQSLHMIQQAVHPCL